MLTLIATISCQYLNAQALKLNSSVLDFGEVAAQAQAPKIIEFENTSAKKLAILLIVKSSDVKVNFVRRFYEPGERGTIAFKYESRNTGAFEETISIHTNLDTEPQKLLLKGTTVSLLECFPDPHNLLKRSIEVIDANTKQPVSNAELELVHNFKFTKAQEVKTNSEGKAVEELPIGQYQITANAAKYEQLVEERYVPKSMPVIILEMNPLKTSPPVPSTPEPLEQPQPEETSSSPQPVITSTDLPENLYAANNLIFLLDISTSMKSGDKFSQLQQAVNNLAMILRPIDNVSIITYSTDATVVLSGINGADKETLMSGVQNLSAYGITRGVRGLQKAYALAEQNYVAKGNNQIILMTDGKFSEKGVSDTYYIELIEGYTNKSISLSIIGFGVDTEAIERMKIMSEAGNGSFILVKSDEFVKEILIDEVKSKSFISD